MFCLCKLQRNALFGLFPSKKNNREEWHENGTYSKLWKYIQTEVINVSKSEYPSYIMNIYLLLINIHIKGSVKRKHLIFAIKSTFLEVIFAH